MPLQRIQASAWIGGGSSPGSLDPSKSGPGALDPSELQAEALQLSAGRMMLNRRAATAAALIVAQGRVTVGVLDDDADLGRGEGVLRAADDVYSLRAEEEALVLVFALAERP